jgi:KAP family P-loop domain
MEKEIENDLKWLFRQIPEKDLLDVNEVKVNRFYNNLLELINGELPKTIGIFGGWGTGKTTFCAKLGKKIHDSTDFNKVIYFNAWRYSSYSEIVPGLIFKVIKSVVPEDKLELSDVFNILSVISKNFVNGVIAAHGINCDIGEILDEISNTYKTKEGLLEKYCGEVDRIQALFQNLIGEIDKPLVVIIDELDRCDPEEAFDAIKKLRVFFSMSEIKIVFLLAVNPFPIGLAMKKQYGFEEVKNDFEAERIVEKFVDNYISLSDTMVLGNFVIDIWKNYFKEESYLPFIVSVDKNNEIEHSTDIRKTTTLFDSITSNNPYYSNLRALRKCFVYLSVSAPEENHDLWWTMWHLEIIKQVSSKKRNEIHMLSKEIGEISAQAMLNTFRILRSFEVLNNENIKESFTFNHDYGHTAYSVYKQSFLNFFNSTMNRLNTKNAIDSQRHKYDLLKNFRIDNHFMNFIISMSCVNGIDRTRFFELAKINSNPMTENNWKNEEPYQFYTDLLELY